MQKIVFDFLDGTKKGRAINFWISVDDGNVDPTVEQLNTIASFLFYYMKPLITGYSVRVYATIQLDHQLYVTDDLTRDYDSDVEEGAKFSFYTSEPLFNQFATWDIRIPTFPESKIIMGTKEVDVSDPAVAVFVTGMTVGHYAGADYVRYTDGRGWVASKLLSAKESFNP